MAPSLPAGPAPASRPGAWTRALRHSVVAWLLVAEPLSLAFALDAALPRLARLGLAVWLVIAARVGLVAAGIALARRLREGAAGAWRGVAAWALAACAVALAAHAAPIVTLHAPSDARVFAALAVAGYVVLALAAWRAGAVTGDATRDSS